MYVTDVVSASAWFFSKFGFQFIMYDSKVTAVLSGTVVVPAPPLRETIVKSLNMFYSKKPLYC